MVKTTYEVVLDGAVWDVVWSVHAQQRTYDRRSHPQVAQVALETLLRQLVEAVPNFLEKYEGQVTIRAFGSSMMFLALKIERKKRKIGVLTYADVTDTYPRHGDRVITIDPNGGITETVWREKNTPYETEVIGSTTD